MVIVRKRYRLKLLATGQIGVVDALKLDTGTFVDDCFRELAIERVKDFVLLYDERGKYVVGFEYPRAAS